MKRVIWLWLLVVFVGIQFGAGWYEKLAIVPMWAGVPPTETFDAMAESGMYRAGRALWPFVSPVVAILAVVNLVLAWRSSSMNRSSWISASALMVVYAATSYGYFVPQMLMFQADGDTWSPERVTSFVDWWTGLNYVRMAIGGVGWLCALRALSLSGTVSASGDAPHERQGR